MPIDATVGGTASNSYVSLEDANTYFSTRLHAETWTSASDADKEAALITATNIIDWYYTYKGGKTTSTQALQWPRAGVTVGNETYPSNSLPKELIMATCELAMVSIDEDVTADNALAGLRKVQAGPLMSQTADNGRPPSTGQLPDAVYLLLKKFMDNAGIRVLRLIRG